MESENEWSAHRWTFPESGGRAQLVAGDGGERAELPRHGQRRRELPGFTTLPGSQTYRVPGPPEGSPGPSRAPSLSPAPKSAEVSVPAVHSSRPHVLPQRHL